MDLRHILQIISVAAIPVLFAITIHEVAHGRVARAFGDHTAEALGRLSLNPIKHVDPFGTVLLPILLLMIGSPFLFGWAKPVPVNARNLRNPKRDMAFVAAAGPAVNLLMAIAWTVIGGIAATGVFGNGVLGGWLFNMAVIGLGWNVLLAVFNMLPIPPLDGGRVLVSLLPPGPARALSRIEPFGLWIVIAAFLVASQLGFTLGPIFPRASGLIEHLFSGS
jgi:Zn-dependent protease